MTMKNYLTIQRPASAAYWDPDNLVESGRDIAKEIDSWLNMERPCGPDGETLFLIPLPDGNNAFPGEYVVHLEGRWVSMSPRAFERQFEEFQPCI